MLIHIFSLSFDSTFGGFNDADVRDFMKDCEVISVRDHFFIHNERPYLALVIQYFPIRQELISKPLPQKKSNELWRRSLSESDMGVFNLLRDWRAQRCKKEGFPPYVLFTNQQLAEIVKLRPQTLSELMKINGIGKAKSERYGSDILKISKIDGGVQIYPPEDEQVERVEPAPSNAEE